MLLEGLNNSPKKLFLNLVINKTLINTKSYKLIKTFFNLTLDKPMYDERTKSLSRRQRRT